MILVIILRNIICTYKWIYYKYIRREKNTDEIDNEKEKMVDSSYLYFSYLIFFWLLVSCYKAASIMHLIHYGA